MGQLEKYGLYVLCLVIFLILGVTIWPGEAVVAAPGQSRPAVSMPESALSGGVADVVGAGRRGGVQGGGGRAADISALLDHVRPPAPAHDPVSRLDQPSGPTSGVGERSQDEVDPQPAPQPAPQPGPIAVERVHVVKRGETMSEIAEEELGSVAFLDQLRRANPGVIDDKLNVGQKLKLPAAGKRTAKTGGARAKVGSSYVEYTIKPGDVLERIAIRELGSRQRVADILALNDGLVPNKLQPGKPIRLPKK